MKEATETQISYQAVRAWMTEKGWQPFDFQEQTWEAFLRGESGLLNAPTGSGKTLALWLPCLIEALSAQKKTAGGVKVLWLTPLRALAKDTHRALATTAAELETGWRVEMRTGDTSAAARQKQQRKMPDCLLTTPESLHLLLATKGHAQHFANLTTVIVDEWHELMGTKRGIQVELALSRLRTLCPDLRVWGVSATVGNLQETAQALVPNAAPTLVRAQRRKQVEVRTLLPERIEGFPWAGHAGFTLLDKVLSLIAESQTTLLFTNTRAMTELWYQKLLEVAPWLAGQMAMHHGSLDREVREWVEEALQKGTLKLVVCTSSLDLGVDFHPVETVIQLGSPKGISRFLQRAGRSGHQPGATSRIYFLPTHALELLEAAALKEAVARVTQADEVQLLERRARLAKPMDVLVQYLVTLAVGGGFCGSEIFAEVLGTQAYRNLTTDEWAWCVQFITTGGESLTAYEEFQKVEQEGTDFYVVHSRRVALRHRLSIGTIVSEPTVQVRLLRGGYVGTLDEYFVARLKVGDTFFFAGKTLELVDFRAMVARVKPSRKKTGQIPRWVGARLPLSSELADLVVRHLANYRRARSPEVRRLAPLLDLQAAWSAVPKVGELLVEQVQTDEGYHVFFYPFEGRMIHELLAGIFAWRISQMLPITFSMAMNDYGFELLSDTEIPLEHALEVGLFSTENLLDDLAHSLNNSEMATRRFREIAAIAGLMFQGYPGKNVQTRHLQASAKMLFEVFTAYEPGNLLVRQAYDEVRGQHTADDRLRAALVRMASKKRLLKHPPRPSPLAFPILVDRMRNQLSSETLEDRVGRIQAELEQFVEQIPTFARDNASESHRM